MLIPLKWLKEYVDFDLTPKALGDKLVAAGFEIEEIIDLSASIKNVKVGRILTMEQHPNADKLKVCSVDAGATVQIVTGATNVTVGDLVPVALDGAILAGGKEIKKGELRGVLSEGMFCGGSELALTDADYPGASTDGVLILDKSARPGRDINEEIGNDDIVLDVGITANRIDANSIYGIAREVAAVTGNPLKPLNLSYQTKKGAGIEKRLTLTNQEAALCPRYMAAMVEDAVVAPSPKLIRDRLRAVGIRPINTIVDITNYVLTEIGQPMHAFDYEKIAGKEIVVRRAQENEKFLALDDKEYTLTPEMLAICNPQKCMAVAGVMGGKNDSVLPQTKTIVLESARFARDSVRKTAKELNLHSASSARFGKGVDFWSQETGMHRALALMEELGVGTPVAGMLDDYKNPPAERTVLFTDADIEHILGIPVPNIEGILNSLTIQTKRAENGVYSSKIPLYREDMDGVNDIAEELVRLYGYDNVPGTLIKDGAMVKGGKTPRQHMTDKLKNVLLAEGAYEMNTYSFVSPRVFDALKLDADDMRRQAVKLLNPLGEELSVMRTTLAHSMLKTIASNYQRGNKSFRLFELAKVYLPKALPLTEYPTERYNLAVGALGEDFYSFKEIFENLFDALRIPVKFAPAKENYLHPTRTAAVFSVETGAQLGVLGEMAGAVSAGVDLDKRAYLAEFDADMILDLAKGIEPYRTVSRYQEIERDLAVVAATEISAAAILAAVNEAGGAYLTSAHIFDVYTGGQIAAGQKSVAIKMTFQSAEKTLKDADVNGAIEAILAKLKEIGAGLR